MESAKKGAIGKLETYLKREVMDTSLDTTSRRDRAEVIVSLRNHLRAMGDSNPRPLASEASTLSTELIALF